MLEQALKPWVEDIDRRADIGLTEAASQLAEAVLEGLERAAQHDINDWLLVSWVPDFCDDAAETVRDALSSHRVDL